MMAARKRVAAYVYLAALFLLWIPFSASMAFARTLDEVKARLDCVTPSDDLPWDEVEKQFGRPDEAPIPAPGSLFQNARIYKDRIIIFHVDKKETVEAGRPKFLEVVKKIEVCKER